MRVLTVAVHSANETAGPGETMRAHAARRDPVWAERLVLVELPYPRLETPSPLDVISPIGPWSASRIGRRPTSHLKAISG